MSSVLTLNIFAMQKILTSLLSLLLFHAASYSDTTGVLPAQYAGSMMPYDLSKVASEPCWSDSLTPIYVAHVARHGARFISSEKKITRLRRILESREMAGSITSAGHDFLVLLDSVAARSSEKWGALSDLGKTEQHMIARNLYRLMPSLLKDARITAISSYVPRVVMTMYEFCHELSWLSYDVAISTSEGKEFNRLVRCFATDSAYNAYRDNGDWEKIYDGFVESNVSPDPARRILGSENKLSDKDLRKTTMEMYDVLQSLAAFGMSPATTEFMNLEEYRSCWQADNLEHYLRNTITPYSNLAANATAPLLEKIIADADNATATPLPYSTTSCHSTQRHVSANLYFGHAETLMPLLSLMRVLGCYYDSTNPETLSEHWRDYAIVPLGAHLDIILLQSPSGRIMTALQLNGSFVPPMPHSAEQPGLLVDWSAYKSYLTSLIKTQQQE